MAAVVDHTPNTNKTLTEILIKSNEDESEDTKKSSEEAPTSLNDKVWHNFMLNFLSWDSLLIQ